MKQLQIIYKAKQIANEVQEIIPEHFKTVSSVEASLLTDIGFRANLVWQLHHLDPLYAEAYEPLIEKINCLDSMLQ